MKADIRGFAAELANQSQRELKTLLYKPELPKKPLSTSCQNLPPNSPSGYYWIYNSTGDPNYEFCDITRRCGHNSTVRGWMRVANMDMAITPANSAQMASDSSLHQSAHVEE